MNYGKQNGQIYKTDNYEIFKILKGNRDYEKRGENLINSIKKYGIITPITCNEKMEIIDGQGRYYAAQQVGAPISYIVIPGLTVSHCTEINSTQKTWTQRDYIKSYADRGNKNYIELNEYIEKYPKLPPMIIWIALKGAHCRERDIIYNGVFKPHSKAHKYAPQALTFIYRVANLDCIRNHIPGRKRPFYEVLMIGFGMGKAFNQDRCIEALKRHIQNPEVFPPFNTKEAAGRSLEKAYNYGQKKNYNINLVGRVNDINQMRLTWWGGERED